ncbi:MAG: omptin family outer membrane protease [Spirochaetaceae bacterium]|jgi:outer membrane protease|nr:omptin family outer membrane protease [Spirochaetaceae bacterium]
MKIIPLFSCFVILGFFASPACHGQIRIFHRPYDFTLTPRAGVFYGTLYEIVYKDATTKNYLSELRWEQKPLWYLGFDVFLGPRDPLQTWGFFLGSSFKAAIPMGTGLVEDRDWLSPLNPPSAAGSLTHFSQHDNNTLGAFFVTFNTGFSVPLWKIFFLQLPISFGYQFIKMEARDGYTQYGNNLSESGPYDSWNPSWPKDSFSGAGIRYSQHWFTLSPGLVLGMNLTRFTLSVSCKLSPFVASISIDDHLVRKIVFTDVMAGGLYLEPALSASFIFNSRLRAGAAFSYCFIRGTRGDEFIDYYGSINAGKTDGVASDCAGAGMELFEGSVFFSIRL